MKKLYYLLGLSVCLLGCNKTPVIEDNKETPTEGKEVVVSLGLGGEITISETPLSTRAAGSETTSYDLYGINVFYDREKDGNTDDPYAYGVFDNINDMVITLLTGYKYKFECTYIPNGKTFSQYYSSSKAAGPFRLNKTSNYNPKIENKFISEGGIYLKYMKYGHSDGYSEIYGAARADRFYGEVADYSPSSEGRVIINMKRCVFGLKINVTGLTDGSLKLGSCFGSEVITASSDGIVRDEIRAFKNVYDCWKSSDDYTQKESMNITWARGNGVSQNLGSQAITVKRNVMTIVNISLVGSSSNNSIGLNVKSSEMSNSTINININADGTVNTNVDPQH